MAIKGRMRIWRELEKKLTKRISHAHKQMECVKTLVSQKQQAEIDIRGNFDQIVDVVSNLVESKLSGRKSQTDNHSNSLITPRVRKKSVAEKYSYRKKMSSHQRVRDITSPIYMNHKRDSMMIITERVRTSSQEHI